VCGSSKRARKIFNTVPQSVPFSVDVDLPEKLPSAGQAEEVEKGRMVALERQFDEFDAGKGRAGRA
jgi:hypothetical protein